MPPRTSSPAANLRGLVLPITIIGAILVFVVPIPPALLDVLLSANLTVAVVVLLTTLSIRTPQEFSAFPTILLTTTLTRLVLNVATTRLVLTRGGEDRLEAAGGVIKAFGEFVAGDQVIVGVILFSILVVIQFVVITRGATRISEVAARFMLDGLPGRQMAIDADLHAGLIDQHEAHRRREDVYRQADFFGAMDGAGKFVRGDAVAGVIILLVNIAGGLYLGMVNYGMSAGEAVNVFTKLTIGDGLVSQVPAFLISLASGLIVTRSSSSTDLNRDVIEQLFTRPGVLGLAAVFVGLMALTPLPKLPLLALGGGLGTAAMLLGSRRQDETVEEDPDRLHAVGRSHASPAPPAGRTRIEELRAAVSATSRGKPAHPAAKPDGAEAAEGGSDRMEDLLHVDPLELEIGFRLISLADPTRSGDLLGRLKTVRQRVAREMGLIVPQVRIHDEIGLAVERISGEDPGYSGRAGGRLRRSAAGRAAGRSGHSPRRPRRG